MTLGEHGRQMSEINVTPLVDVMLVLLVIFIVTAPLLRSGVDVSLPKSSSLPSISREGVDVTLKADGSVFIDRLPVRRDNLVEAFKQITSNKPNTPVYLRAEKTLSYATVIEVVDLLREAGVIDLGLVTNAEPVKLSRK